MTTTVTDRLSGVSTSVAVKPPCKVAAIANITLFGEQTVNSVAVTEGDRVLVTAQTSSVDNGIWVVGTATWARAKDFDGTRDVVDGTLVLVGTTAAASQFWLAYGNQTPIVPGTSQITFEQVDYQELALRADLAASSGASLVGFLQSGTGAVGRTVQDKLRSQLEVDEFIDPTQLAFIRAGDLASQTRATTQAGLVAAITAAVAQGRRLKLGMGIYGLSGNISLPDGLIMEGEGNPTSAGFFTRLDFATNTAALPSFYTNNGSDVVLRNFYLQGRTSGSGNEIENQGNSRRMTYESLAVVTSTTGSGIAFSTSGYNIQSEATKVVVVGAGYGFSWSVSSTSITLKSCYANVCTEGGYLVQGTYHSLLGCASDGNFYGYVLQNAKSIGMVGCGAESCSRSALIFSAADGIVMSGFRSVSNNAGANAAIPSFAFVNDSSTRIYGAGLIDTTPNAATVNSVGSNSGTVGDDIELLGSFTLPFGSTTQAKLTTRSGLYAVLQFDGTAGSPVPVVSRKVSGITKNGTGDYTITVTTPSPGTFTLFATGNCIGSGANSNVLEQVSSTSNTVRVRCRVAGVLTDSAIITLQIFAL